MLIGVIKKSKLVKVTGQVKIRGTAPSCFANGYLEICLKMEGVEIMCQSSLYPVLQSNVVSATAINHVSKKSFIVTFHLNLSYDDVDFPLLPNTRPLPFLSSDHDLGNRSHLLVLLPKRITNPPMESRLDSVNGVSEITATFMTYGCHSSSIVPQSFENRDFGFLPYLPNADITVVLHRGRRFLGVSSIPVSNLIDLLESPKKSMEKIPNLYSSEPHPRTCFGFSQLFCIGRRENQSNLIEGNSNSCKIKINDSELTVELF
ncbi:hypothetical protein GEMRC1_007679 [Eukaryota sp. GEM-RC1]